MTEPPVLITVQLANGTTFEVELDAKLWIDLQAFCFTFDCTIEEAIREALSAFLKLGMDPRDARA